MRELEKFASKQKKQLLDLDSLDFQNFGFCSFSISFLQTDTCWNVTLMNWILINRAIYHFFVCFFVFLFDCSIYFRVSLHFAFYLLFIISMILSLLGYWIGVVAKFMFIIKHHAEMKMRYHCGFIYRITFENYISKQKFKQLNKLRIKENKMFSQ